MRPSRAVAGVDLGIERPLPGVVGRLEDRAEAVGRHLVGAHDAEVALVGAEPEDVGDTTRRAASSELPIACPGDGTSTACLSRSGSLRSLRSFPPLTCGFAPMRRSPVGQLVDDLGDRGAALVEQLLRAVRAQPLLEDLQVARGPSSPSSPAPGAPSRCPRPGCRRPPSGRSSPWATCSTIIGQRGRSGTAAAAADLLLELADLAVRGVERARRARRRAVVGPSTISGCQP